MCGFVIFNTTYIINERTPSAYKHIEAHTDIDEFHEEFTIQTFRMQNRASDDNDERALCECA